MIGVSKEEACSSLEIAEKEILSLRDQVRFLSVQVKTVDRLLSAIEQHNPNRYVEACSEDVLWKIRDTKNSLAKDIEEQKRYMNENMGEKCNK